MFAAVLLAGSLALHPCADAAGYFCGTYERPLDRTNRVAGTVDVGFTWLPHSRANAPPAGTIVAAEGGPGYPSGGSRDAYQTLFGPLLQTHDLLMMDDRGTGRSGAIDCTPLQSGAMTLAAVASCGTQLGDRSDLYGTAPATDDLADLMRALHVGGADFYGDSYGTFFVQVFAARHPGLVRSVTLDGAYPALGDDPWYPSTAPAIRDAFDRVCRRDPACSALPGTTMQRIGALLHALRERATPITATQLAFVMDSAGLDPIVYRELDAATRAYIGGRDAVPLQRLAREVREYEEAPQLDPHEMSQGLFVAASCSDNPQAYDMRLPPHARSAAWQRALDRQRQHDPHLYAPFTLDEFLAMPLDYAYLPLCQNWPVASAAYPAGRPVPIGSRMPDVPALVLTGDLDTITTPAEGDAAAALFAHAQRTIVANTAHVTAIGDPYACASQIVRDFVERRALGTQCAGRIPPVRLVAAFAKTSAGIAPARAVSGNPTPRDLQLAAVAVIAAGDVLARVITLGARSGSGLRGGSYDARTHEATTIAGLYDVRWTQDLAVSGTETFDSRNGRVDARLSWNGASLHATWNEYAGASRASLDGSVGGRELAAVMPAP